MAHPFITDAQATQKIQEIYNDIVNSIGTGFQGTIKIADTPTEEGIYIPTEVGTYPNAGGLEYAPEGDDEGYLVQFIYDGSGWVKSVVEVSVNLDAYASKDYVSNIVDSTIKDFAGSISENVDSVIDLTLTVGSIISSTGGVSSNPAGYRRTTTSNPSLMIQYSGGALLYTGEITVSGRAGVAFFDENMNYLGFDAGDIRVYNKYQVEVPENTKYIGACSFGEPILEFRKIVLKGLGESSGTFVDVNFSGESNGSFTKPFNTFKDAIENISNVSNSTIIVREGIYRESIDLSALEIQGLKIQAYQNEKVMFFGSDQITGFSKTSGYTNIYEAVFSKTIPTQTRGGKRIFEFGRSSKPISESERHSLQRGLSHRLPFSEISEIDFDTDVSTTLGLLDSSAGSYYHDSANNKIYIHTSDSEDPQLSGFSYEVQQRILFIPPVKGKDLTLELSFIEGYFSSGFGFDFKGIGKVLRNNVCSFGSSNNGFSDECAVLVAYKDESGASGNDGAGGHFTRFPGYASGDFRSMVNSARYIEPWYHDNRDDGISHHEFSDVTCIGGLFEYNRKAGIIPANGGNWRQYGGLARNNGNGFYVGNAMLGKPYSVAYVQNFTAEKNGYNFRLSSDSAWILELDNCVSREATTAGYSSNLGKMIALNCKSTQSNGKPHKEELGGGSIEVINDDDLI